MISIENSPSDPSSSSCPCSDQNRNRNQNQIPQLISSSGSDEKKASAAASTSDNKLAFVEEEEKEVDLLKSSLDDSNPLPQFSIRDYVFSSRSKDISRNWPFSVENLNLCLKHGVTNLLPPFQPLDSLKNPTVNRCTIEKSLPDYGIVSSCDGEPSKQTYQFVSATSDSVKYNPVLASDPGNKTPNCVELGADSLVEASKQKPELEVPPASHQKTESTIQSTQIKKCRLVVKSNPLVEPASTSEDITPNNFMVSETMASKVCPVCKTFSSSSNTTLNAHIDQCLSGESTMKWTANSKVIKNRVKPRKTRLMVDIYKTAPYCTLEELDRRNGTNWATNSIFPSQEIEFYREEKEREQKVSNDNVVETGHEGDVYIDTDGTKVRILSVPKIGVTDDHGPRKLLKGKGSKFLTSKKRKKTHEEKHHKFLKLSPRSKKFCSPKPRRGFEMQSNQEENFSVEGGCQKEDRQKQRFQAHEELEFDEDRGTIKPWVCSRRSGHAKKDSRYNMTRNLPVESGQRSLEKRCVLRTPNLSDNPISSPESSKGTDTSPYEPQVDEYREQPLLRKRVGFRSGSSASNKVVGMTDPSNNTDDFAISSNARRLSSLKKNLLSVNRESMSESSSNLKRKFSALKKTRLHVGPSQVGRLQNPLQDSSRHQSRMDDVTGETSLGGLNVMETRKKRGGIKISGKEEALSVKSSQLQTREKIDSSVQHGNTKVDTLGEGESSRKEIETHYGSLTVQPNSRTSVGGNFLNAEFDSQLESQRCIGVYRGPFSEAEGPICSPQPSVDDKDKMFCEDDTGKTMTGQNICNSAESDSKEMGHGDYFTDVEPIPIPGPPGSFLPSPGADMVSEDLQGNSSLTNSRVQSSEDHLDLVDRDSMSDSPISATSTISNPTLTRSNSRSSEKLSVRSVTVEENFALVRRASNMVSERPNAEDWRASATFPEKGLTPVLKSDQPCCCSRKEGVSQSVASTYQESALLRRRAMESHKRLANCLNFKSETFSHSNYPPEKVFLPAENSHGRHLPMTPSADCAASPSSSNPVLRLMGKDLMVVKKDEDVAPQLRPPQSSSMSDHPNRQFLSVPAASPGNLQNEDYHSLHQVLPLYGHNHNDSELQHIDFRSYVQPQTQQTPIHGLERSFTNTTMLAGGYMTSVDSYGLSGSHPHLVHQAPIHALDRSTNRYDIPLARDRNAFPASNNPIKEIIIIDDSPENEADLATHAMHDGGMRSNRVSSSSIPIHFTSGYNPRHVNSFYNNQSQGCFSYVGTPVVDSGCFPRPLSREVDASPAKWNCIPEGSVRVSSPSTAHLRSTMYYPPPSFS